jgi:DNA-3-methyladenine glycosylase I
MPLKQSYCQYALNQPPDDVDRRYHDTQYGFPLTSDAELFGRFILEIFQAGLSWRLILQRQENFRDAFSGFSIQAIARYDQEEVERLLADAGIIRNRRKIEAVIYNAQQVAALQEAYGSFKEWLDHHHPLALTEWLQLFKAHFKFTGPEITKEFLMSTGYLAGAHQPDCPVYKYLAGE